MGISEREHHIKVLENILSHYKAREKCEGYYDNTLKDNVEALQYAISSLKTDFKYDLIHEGKDVYTKDEVIGMLVGLEVEIDEESWTIEWPDGTDEIKIEMESVSKVIQQKINKLKEQKSE